MDKPSLPYTCSILYAIQYAFYIFYVCIYNIPLETNLWTIPGTSSDNKSKPRYKGHEAINIYSRVASTVRSVNIKECSIEYHTFSKLHVKYTWETLFSLLYISSSFKRVGSDRWWHINPKQRRPIKGSGVTDDATTVYVRRQADISIAFKRINILKLRFVINAHLLFVVIFLA